MTRTVANLSRLHTACEKTDWVCLRCSEWVIFRQLPQRDLDRKDDDDHILAYITRALEIQRLQSRGSYLRRSPRIRLPEVAIDVDELTVKIDELRCACEKGMHAGWSCFRSGAFRAFGTGPLLVRKVARERDLLRAFGRLSQTEWIICGLRRLSSLWALARGLDSVPQLLQLLEPRSQGLTSPQA